MEFSPPVFVVSDEQDRLANNRNDRVLVLLRQALQQSWRNAPEHNRLAGVRSAVRSAHGGSRPGDAALSTLSGKS
jgi:hypothetical protein